MSESPNNSDSPVRIQEAESTQDSPEIEQECPQSPDSTFQEFGSHVQPSTSANRHLHVSDENRNITDSHGNLRLLAGSSAANVNLITQGGQSSTSTPSSRTQEINILRENQPKLFSLLTRNTDNKDVINQTDQSTTSRHIPKPSTSPRTGSRVDGNPLLTNMLIDNPAINANLINQRQERSESKLIPQYITSTRPKVRQTQPTQVVEHGEQSSSIRMPQSSLSAAQRASSSQQPGRSVEGNTLFMLMDNPAVNQNLSIRERPRAASGPNTQFSTSTRPISHPPETLQTIQQREQSSTSRQMAEPSLSIKRNESRPGQIIEENPLLTNMFFGNLAAYENLPANEKQGEQWSAYRPTQSSAYAGGTSSPAQSRNLIKQGEQSSASRLPQPSTSITRSAATPTQRGIRGGNPLLTNMLMGNQGVNQNFINQGRQRTASEPIPRFSASTSSPISRAEQIFQAHQQREQSSSSRQMRQPSRSTERNDSCPGQIIKENPLLTNMFFGNSASYENLAGNEKQGQQWPESRSTQSGTYAAGTSSSPVQSHQSHQSFHQASHQSQEQRSASRLPKPSSPITRSSATPTQHGVRGGNPLLTNMLMDNQAINQNLINQGRQRTASEPIPRFNASTSSPISRPAQTFQELEKSSTSRQMAQRSHSIERNYFRPGQVVEKNPLLTNMFSDSPSSAANENKGQQRSASLVRAQSRACTGGTSSSLSQPHHLNEGVQSSASRLPQPSTTSRSASTPTQPGVSVGNPLLTNMLQVNPAAHENLSNRGRQSVFGAIPRTSTSTRATSSPSKTSQVIKQEQSTVHRQVVQPSLSNASASKPGEIVKTNPLLTKMITVNPAANESLINRRQQSSATGPLPQSTASTTKPTSRPTEPSMVAKQGDENSDSSQMALLNLSTTSSSPQPDEQAQGNLLLTNMFMVNPVTNEKFINQRQQSSESGQIPQSSASMRMSSPAQTHQTEREQSFFSKTMAQPSISAERTESNPVKKCENPLLTEMFSDNLAANQNKGQQSSSLLSVQPSDYTGKTSSRPVESHQLSKQVKLSSSSRLPQPSTSTTRSKSIPTQHGVREQNPLLTNMLKINPAVNENLLKKERQSSESKQISESRNATEKLESSHLEARQILKQKEESSSSRLMDQSSFSIKSTYSPCERVPQNPLPTNKFTDNSAANENLSFQGKHWTTSAGMTQTDPARSTFGPAQPHPVSEKNKLLTNILGQSSNNESMANRGESGSSSGQIIPESPRRKREDKDPDPQPSCSPTKKKKSPNKKK